MPLVAFRKLQWDAGNGNQSDLMKFATEAVELGEPAVWDDGLFEQCLFYDVGLTLTDAAYLGAAAAGWQASRNRPVNGGSADEKRVDVRDRISGDVVLPEDVQLTEIVQVEVPVRIQVEYPVLDENGDPTGETYLVWEDHPTDTRLVDVEQPLGDPYMLVVGAQVDVPDWIQMFSSVPDGWVPVGGEV